METRRLSHTAGRNVNWYSHYREQFESESHSVMSTLCDPMDYTIHGIL